MSPNLVDLAERTGWSLSTWRAAWRTLEDDDLLQLQRAAIWKVVVDMSIRNGYSPTKVVDVLSAALNKKVRDAGD